jgi:hypothetical protein
MYRNNKTIELVMIFLLIIFTIFVHFIVAAHMDYFSKSLSINKSDFYKIILVATFRAVLIDAGLIYFYYRDKKRLKRL